MTAGAPRRRTLLGSSAPSSFFDATRHAAQMGTPKITPFLSSLARRSRVSGGACQLDAVLVLACDASLPRR